MGRQVAFLYLCTAPAIEKPAPQTMDTVGLINVWAEPYTLAELVAELG
jgi:hypothetical protein